MLASNNDILNVDGCLWYFGAVSYISILYTLDMLQNVNTFGRITVQNGQFISLS